MEGRRDGNGTLARGVPADQRAEPLLRGVRRARHVEASVAPDPRCFHGHRFDEEVGGRLRAGAGRDRLRSAGTRPHSGCLPGDVVRAVRRRCRGATPCVAGGAGGRDGLLAGRRGRAAARDPPPVAGEQAGLVVGHVPQGRLVSGGVRSHWRSRRQGLHRNARRDGVHGTHPRRQGIRRLSRKDEGAQRQRPRHQRRRHAFDSRADDGHRRRRGRRTARTCAGHVHVAWGRRRAGRGDGCVAEGSGRAAGHPAGDVAHRRVGGVGCIGADGECVSRRRATDDAELF